MSFCLQHCCTARLKVNDSQMPREGCFWDEELQGVKLRRVRPVVLSWFGSECEKPRAPRGTVVNYLVPFISFLATLLPVVRLA